MIEASTAASSLGALEEASGRLEEIAFASIHSVTPRKGDIDLAIEGRFRLHDDVFALAPPIDWWDAPYRAGGNRAFLQNSLLFADPLLADPRRLEVLGPLAAIFTDWIEANPRRSPPHPHRFAWHDHAAAARLVYLAFALREAVRAGSLSPETRLTLMDGILDHVEFLLAEENHASAHNHGLFADAALGLAARSLSPLPQSGDWSAVAETRFRAILEGTISGDGMHLEHSPQYQWVVRGALARFSHSGIFPSAGLERVVRRMDEAGAWLVAPDGTLPPIGDTPYGRRPPPAAEAAAAGLTGLRIFPEAGYAAVRDADSFLVVTAGHHQTGHKHADDSSFCLYESGAPIVLDSGDPGYEYESRERRHGVSPAAHATVEVDGFDWAAGAPAYGSGVIAAVESHGRFAILTRNPHAVAGHRAATRLVVYEPRSFLAAVDLVDAGAEEVVERHLPLAPGITVEGGADGVLTLKRDGVALGRLFAFPEEGAPPESVELALGRWGERPSGWAFPRPTEIVPRWTVTFAGAGGTPRALLLTLGEVRAPSPRLVKRVEGDAVEVTLTGPAAGTLRLRVDGGRLSLNGDGR